VKNLENVQGDERDLMIFSIGYAPPEVGTFAMRFGPLNQAGGERRLNVAITRAWSRIIVVSSIRGEQIDLSKTNAPVSNYSGHISNTQNAAPQSWGLKCAKIQSENSSQSSRGRSGLRSRAKVSS
jgi:hypothetical protein